MDGAKAFAGSVGAGASIRYPMRDEVQVRHELEGRARFRLIKRVPDILKKNGVVMKSRWFVACFFLFLLGCGFPKRSGPPVRSYLGPKDSLLYLAIIPSLDRHYMGKSESIGLEFDLISNELERSFKDKSISYIYDYSVFNGASCKYYLAGRDEVVCVIDHRWLETYPDSGVRCLSGSSASQGTHPPPCEGSVHMVHKFSRKKDGVAVVTSTRERDVQ